MGIVVTLLAVAKSDLDNSKPIERQLQCIAEVECGKRLLSLLERDPQGDGRDDSTGDFFHWADSSAEQTAVCAQALLKVAKALNNQYLDEFGFVVAQEGLNLLAQALALITENDHMVALRWA